MIIKDEVTRSPILAIQSATWSASRKIRWVANYQTYLVEAWYVCHGGAQIPLSCWWPQGYHIRWRYI